ncbi:subtilisin-like protease SBT3.6 isoform X1 [Cucumis melo var. makuwa]|uniref:Subtilisin-like protease SBT3.6 isoform X1 n=1 Tax=Cucumis melo var. makuwa TaxID=1194695 RepID=A0A5D3CQM0_CUCMM|nr:subtilisin-like protease SBT3.6 isoform X1 [Cucumis melo var. makuwa]TYK14091.1 subtilisin-like protease SBT3.6 isoform X1 [Cucumis melo var. makuwa]
MSSQSSSIPLVSNFDSPAVHIVYTERPHNEAPEAYHIRTLVSVLGSEEAAREALVYSYKNAASGFSARLTPDQVTEITKFGMEDHDSCGIADRDIYVELVVIPTFLVMIGCSGSCD